MKKYLRFLLILAILVVFVAVAGSQTAWAGKLAAPAAGLSNAMDNSVSLLTTVRPEGCGAETPIDGTVSTLCGIATIVSDNGRNIGMSYLGNRPDGFKNKKVSVLFSEPGGAILCFGAKDGGTIYFYNMGIETWVPIATTVENGIACARIYASGDYVIGK